VLQIIFLTYPTLLFYTNLSPLFALAVPDWSCLVTFLYLLKAL
jgi:hypothetical protein